MSSIQGFVPFLLNHLKNGRTGRVEQTLAGTPGYSLVEVKAEVFRARGYAVVPDPLPENPAHTLVRGKISKIHAREIAGIATWIVLHPPDAATDI